MGGETHKQLPRHVAIIMDGNGRWAAARGATRAAGHRAGLKPVRLCVEECTQRGIEALTLFAFSSENWGRPAEEVGSLMGLFVEALDREIAELHKKGVRVRFIGARHTLSARLQRRIRAAEERTAENPGLKLQVAVSYGGRWDIIQAAQKLALQCSKGSMRPEDLTEEHFAQALSLAGLPGVDLLIRTGGEQRISNFLLWDLAYAELHFSARLWPDFAAADLEEALVFFTSRERRFGRRPVRLSTAQA
jgi:undecaprenyl diphosphate synthase